jgi:uncharacterized protein with HEPN domain
MRPDAPALLWDARRAVQLIQDFIAGESLDKYEHDAMLRSAVERQFEIIGEALNKLKRADPDTAARITDLPKIVAFRNILAHGYATIDNVLVWEFANTRLVDLSDVLDRLMEESPDSP